MPVSVIEVATFVVARGCPGMHGVAPAVPAGT